MPTFKSAHPDIDVPWHLPVWTWLFDSDYSPLKGRATEDIGGFTNVITKEFVSYLEIKEYSTHLSTALVKNYGLKPGQTVSLFSQNTVWYPVAMFGAVRVGGVVNGASPAYGVDEMAYALDKANTQFLFTVPSSMKVAVDAANKTGLAMDRIFLLEGEHEGFKTIQQLIQEGKNLGSTSQVSQFCFPAGKKGSDVLGYLSFSSGTTGLPKAVMISHSNIIAQCLQLRQINPEWYTRFLAALPLFHIAGLVGQMHLPMLLNANVYMLPYFTMDMMLQTAQDYKLKELLLIPPILLRLVREPETLKKYDLSALKSFLSGAAPLPAETLDLLQKAFPKTGFRHGYGMTESGACITLAPPDKYDYKYAFRVGSIVASTEVKIVDAVSGKECGLNEPGEILARGPQITMGYLNNSEATKETYMSDGYLRTGDIGSIDAEGLMTIIDRAKELIKVKGLQVAPAELEDLLHGHPDVEDVACLGVADEYDGERPKAFVVLKRGFESDPQSVGHKLIQYVKEKRIQYKWIKEVEIVQEIPKSASGKILRRVLRDLSEQGAHGVVVKDENVAA